MNITNLKIASDYEVQKWLIDNIKDLTPYQIQKIRDMEIVRNAPFEFMKYKDKTDNIWLRLTIFLIIPVYILLILGLPFCYIITGRWGYKKINWFSNWLSSCGL